MKVRITVDVEVPSDTDWVVARTIGEEVLATLHAQNRTTSYLKVQVVRPPKKWVGLTEIEYGKR